MDELYEKLRQEIMRCGMLEQELAKLSALLVAIVGKVGPITIVDDDFVEGELLFEQDDNSMVVSLKND